MSEIKRMRYFKEEFLKNEDFIDEQEYHRRMRYRHNKEFHTWGIGDGLEVTFTPGAHSVDISPGIAMDGEGKEIIIEEPQILDFSEAGYEGGESYYITITWSQEEGEPKQENEAKRWMERPEINASETLPAQPELALLLARVTLNPDRTVAAIDDPGRHYAQIGIPDGSVTEAKLNTSVQAKLVTGGDAHTHSAGDIGAVSETGGTIDGNLQVKGDVNITNVIDFGDTTDLNDHWRFTTLQWPTTGDFAMDRRVSGTYVGSYLTITTGGRVGIGPGAGIPQETLHVNGSVRGNQEGGALRIKTINGYVDIGPRDQNNTHFMTDRETFYFNKKIIVDGGEIGSGSVQDMKLQTGGETKVTIKQDTGNVGINTLSPEGALHVKGHNANSYFESDGDETHLILRTNEGTDNHVHFVNRPGGRAAIRVNADPSGKDSLTVLREGNVGIGTETPLYKLDVAGDIKCNNSLYSPGRLNLSAEEWIYLLARDGIRVSAEGENAGYLMIDGNLTTNGTSWAANREGAPIDYAEYFESKNGKEIKPGTSVVLEGDKIRPAKKGEHPFGIISTNPLITGGVPIEWPKKFLRDEFGNQIMEEYKEEIMAPKKKKVRKERQKREKKRVKEKVTRKVIAFEEGKYFQKEIKETVEKEIEVPVFKEVDLYDAQKKNIIGKHRIPVMETYEEEVEVLDENGQPVMAGTGKFETRTRPKINPEYDETKEYIPRQKRPEWNCVGLLGQLPLRKGQPAAPTWVKLKDISKDVELWLVK